MSIVAPQMHYYSEINLNVRNIFENHYGLPSLQTDKDPDGISVPSLRAKSWI